MKWDGNLVAVRRIVSVWNKVLEQGTALDLSSTLPEAWWCPCFDVIWFHIRKVVETLTMTGVFNGTFAYDFYQDLHTPYYMDRSLYSRHWAKYTSKNKSACYHELSSRWKVWKTSLKSYFHKFLFQNWVWFRFSYTFECLVNCPLIRM